MDSGSFGRRIAQARVACGLTQLELARRLDTREMSVSRWERGVNVPSGRTLVALAGELGVTVEHLVGGHALTVGSSDEPQERVQ